MTAEVHADTPPILRTRGDGRPAWLPRTARTAMLLSVTPGGALNHPYTEAG